MMGAVTIRKLPNDVEQELHKAAASTGHTVEFEARRALIKMVRSEAKTVEKTDKQKSFFQKLYDISRPGFDLQIPQRTPARIPDLNN
jgi:plasmid stability protein